MYVPLVSNSVVSSPWQKSRASMRGGFGPDSRRRSEAVLTEIRASFDNEEAHPKTQAATARLLPRAARVFGRVVVLRLLFSASAHAASVTWAPVNDISGPGTTTVSTFGPSGGGNGVTITNGTNDVNTQGTQVLGVNFSGKPGNSFPYTTTINGQNFFSAFNSTGDTDTATFSTQDITNFFDQFTPGPAGQSYGNFQQTFAGQNPDYTLANAIFGNSLTGSFSLGNLTPGVKYLLQFWVSDPRNAVTVFRQETLTSSTGGDTNIPTLNYEGNGTDGQWVTGTFVADATGTETFNLSARNSNVQGDGSPQINLLQLRDISVPQIPQWGITGSGNWLQSGNWSTGTVPNGVDGDAELLGKITANSNLYADTPITEGTIHFNNAHSYVIDGAAGAGGDGSAGHAGLILQTSTGNAMVIVDAGTQVINLPTNVASNTVFTVATGSTLVISNPIFINSGMTLTQTGAGSVVYSSIINVGSTASIAFGNSTHANTLKLAAGATATVGGSGTVL